MGWFGVYQLIKAKDWKGLKTFIAGEADPEASIYVACYHIAIDEGMLTQERVRQISDEVYGKLAELERTPKEISAHE